jgi:hypothetical protein
MTWLADFVRANYLNATPIPSEITGSVRAAAGRLAMERGDRPDAADNFASAAIAYSNAHNPVQHALVVGEFAKLLSEPSPTPLAEGMTDEEQFSDRLHFALMAIEIFHDVRYCLPTSQWRPTRSVQVNGRSSRVGPQDDRRHRFDRIYQRPGRRRCARNADRWAQFTREQLEADLRRERAIVARRLLAEDLSTTAHQDVIELLKLEARVYAPHRDFQPDWIS